MLLRYVSAWNHGMCMVYNKGGVVKCTNDMVDRVMMARLFEWGAIVGFISATN